MNAPDQSTSPAAGRARRRSAGVAVLRFMWKAQSRWMLLGAVLAACTGIMGSALLGLSGWFITATAIAGLGAATALLFDVFVPSAGIRLLALGRTGSRYAQQLVTHDATLGILARLRGQLFRGWATPGAAQALQLRPARLLFRLTGDLDALQALYLRLLVPCVAAALVVAFTAVAMGLIHLWVGVAAGGWLLLTGFGVVWWMQRRSVRTSARSVQALERLRARAVDLVAGQTDLLMAGQLPQQRSRLLHADGRLAEQELALNRTEVWGNGTAGVVQALSLALALLASVWLVRDGMASAPVAAFILLLVLVSGEPLAALRRGAVEAGRSVLAARRIAPRLQAQNHEGRPALPSSPQEVLRLEDVSHVYAPGAARPLVALHRVSVRLQRGARLAVVGGSGSGKSTLLALVAGELALQRGRLHAQPACWLTQRSELFQDTVRGNLDLARRYPDDAVLWQALEHAGLAEVVRSSSAGLDTFLGEGGLGLSGGQARRLALARLLLSGHDFWLLDEPTEGLDFETAADVLRRLDEQARQKTLVIATHLQREAELATEIMVLEQGRAADVARRGTAQFGAAVAQLRPG